MIMSEDICRNYHGGNQYSEAAFNETSDDFFKKVQEAINRLMTRRGETGLTCDEAEVLLDLPHQTCSARFSQMKKDGMIYDTGLCRKTRRNRNATVFVSDINIFNKIKADQKLQQEKALEEEWS